MPPYVRVFDDDGQSHRLQIDKPIYVNGRAFNVDKRMVGGGNGDLFFCQELRIGQDSRPFALKVLTQNRDNRIDRFKNEAEVLAKLKHPNILPLIGSGSFSIGGIDVPWILMELGGFNLGIHVNGNSNAGISPVGTIVGEQFKSVAIQMCDALEHLHSLGYIHRDIKPANFVWTCRFRFDSVSLIDFGLCKKVGEDTACRPFDQITLDNEVVGPRMLFSPELCQYAIDKTTLVDERSDFWQLSRVLWFLATGRLSTGRPSRKIDPFNGQLHKIADVMSNDDPDDRIQTMARLRKEIDQIVV